MKILFHQAIILVFTVSLNACLLEQVIFPDANSFLSEHGSEAPNLDDHAVPSHKHDSDSHEDDFCCDNNLMSYIGPSSIFPTDLFELNNLSCYINLGALEIEAATKHSLRSLRSTIQPPRPRARDQYALCSLLHAPPHA